MASHRRAIIDVGTNSVKLLVADVAGRAVTPVLEKSQQTRLGSGFYETHVLQRAAIDRTANAIAQFAAEAAQLRPQSTRVIATSAARDARNQADLRSAIAKASGLAVEIISGEQEADWVFAGVTSDPVLAAQPLLIMDVGGGSTEFILSNGATQVFRQSFRMGTVRLLEQIRPSDPPQESEWLQCQARLRDFLTEEVRPQLEAPQPPRSDRPEQLVGTGGTASILAAMRLQLAVFDRSQIDAVRLSREEVGDRQKSLWKLSMSERKVIAGLPPNRADVILMGVAIYAAVMEHFGFADLRISTRGLRFAAIMDPV